MKRYIIAAVACLIAAVSCSKEKVDISLTIDIENGTAFTVGITGSGNDFSLAPGEVFHWSATVRGEDWNGACYFPMPFKENYSYIVNGKTSEPRFSDLCNADRYRMDHPAPHIYKLKKTLMDHEIEWLAPSRDPIYTGCGY